MSGPLVVLGSGGHAKVVVATAAAAGFDVRSVLDDDRGRWGCEVLGVAVDGPLSRAVELGLPCVIAIGDNRTRRWLAERVGGPWATVVHPSALVHPTVQLGEGTVVFAGAVVQPDTMVGSHTIINTGASVDHDCRLGDFVHVAPGVRLAGDVELGEGVFMGIGSCAIPGVRVGPWAVVGAGAAVVGDLSEGVTAVGVPARPLRRHG